MPSPFPGMDPYLESTVWMSIHNQLCAEIARQLSPQILPKYLALSAERFVMSEPDLDGVSISSTDTYPDVGVKQVDDTAQPARATTATVTAPLQIPTVIPERIPHVSVEIRDVANRELVTVIEVLSPTNKKGGREEYLDKRRKILLSSAHLIEIDLLRGGARVPMRDPLPSASYFVVVSRSERRPMTSVWPIALNEQLPVVPVPLRAPDADVELDLQLAFSNVYEILGYQYANDYENPPAGDFSPEELAWIDNCLRTAGLRK